MVIRKRERSAIIGVLVAVDGEDRGDQYLLLVAGNLVDVEIQVIWVSVDR